MLRYVFRLHRRRNGFEYEAWVDYLQRTAVDVDKLSKKYGLEDWGATYRRRKWSFAGRTACKTDEIWSKQILSWIPSFGLGRCQGRPRTRWSDEIVKLAGGDWEETAQDEELWSLLSEGFAAHVS